MREPLDHCRTHLFGFVTFIAWICLRVVSAQVASACPTVVELKNVGDSQTISSNSLTNDVTRWIVKANGHPIKITVTDMWMGQWRIDNQVLFGCWDAPLLKVVDNKYPLFPLVTACGPGHGVDLPRTTSFADFLNITHIGSSTFGTSFTMELTAVECGQDHYICSSDKSKCVPKDKVCDGQQDCPQGEDEICTEQCGEAGPYNKKEKFSGKILGGLEAARHSWPWQVFLYADDGTNKGTCGGSIVAPQWVLTAAHCCVMQKTGVWKLDQLKLYAGSHVKYDSPAINVVKIIPHTDFGFSYNTDFQSIHHDFCMLKLAQPLVYTEKVQPICLAQLPHPPPKTSCYATGWGRKDSSNMESYSENLMEVDLRIKSNEECSAQAQYAGIRYMSFVSPETVCTLGSKSTCHGDSGGPLVCRLPKTDHFQWQLVGLTSYGAGLSCNTGPIYFARIRRGLAFMANVLYDEKYEGWNLNRTIRRFDPSVQYDRGDYVIDTPPRADEPSYEVEGVRSNTSWVADESCFLTPPPSPVTTAVLPAGTYTPSSVKGTTQSPSSASSTAFAPFAAMFVCLSHIHNLKTVGVF